MNLKKISGSDRAGIYVISPHEDVYADDYKKFVDWLEEHCPNEYEIDHSYLTITTHAEVLLALTFNFV